MNPISTHFRALADLFDNVPESRVEEYEGPTFDEAFVRLIGHEGGYVNHPSDPGGATNWGITERVARDSGYYGDMRHLTKDTAKSIYLKSYWDPLKIDQLPGPLRQTVFDAGVNSGVVQAAKWLQRAVGAKADGVIGPMTLAAVSAVNPYVVVSKFNGVRLKFMTDLAHWPSFSKGWARRIADNLLETQ